MYNNRPATTADVGSIVDLRAGSSHVIGSEACAVGQRIGYEISATGTLDLEYFQDYNPAPIGLYITACWVRLLLDGRDMDASTSFTYRSQFKWLSQLRGC